MTKQYENYEDIINMERPVSKAHPRMDMGVGAAQFMPFVALTGYEEAIKETERLTDTFVDMDENEKMKLDIKLSKIRDNLLNQPEITVKYFKEDLKKSGGHYLEYTGRVKKIDEYKMTIKFTDNMEINVKNILDIEDSMK